MEIYMKASYSLLSTQNFHIHPSIPPTNQGCHYLPAAAYLAFQTETNSCVDTEIQNDE